ncbi:MAG: hypothetical protein N2747_05295 [Chitinophagaceae bacterium]|nr:hypothetical protein [Chitinophagaceae bacterium]
MNYYFPTKYNEILNRVSEVNPKEYGKTRNYIYGAVSYLSPYISRGVISHKRVWEYIQQSGYGIEESYKFLQELSWREYFQRAWQHLEDDIFEDIRNHKTGIQNRKIPSVILHACTGIEAIDSGIKKLYETGYMHNHVRMYVASIICNIARCNWLIPSHWMYYHLLDGDPASNMLNWQWVAGTFSGKQYFANQENINKYCGTTQRNTFLDVDYNQFPLAEIPDVLKKLELPELITELPDCKKITIDTQLPVLIYNSFNLDPLWRNHIKANRILLLEPSHFRKFPVSKKVLQFIIDLSKNIEGIQIFTGEIHEIPGILKCPQIYSKEHPAFKHYPGLKDPRDWLFPEVEGFYPSFFRFWKKCEKYLYKFKEKQIMIAC